MNRSIIALTRKLTAGATLLILTAALGCDNVGWGGADVQIVPPPPQASMIPIEPDAQVFAEFGLPSGPVIFHLTETEQGLQLLPVAEAAGDSLRALRQPAGVDPAAFQERFRETVIPPGAQFDVYRRGAMVGTFTVRGEGPVTPCGIPTATGNATVVAAAVGSPEFLAFRSGLAPEVRGNYSPPQITGSIRTYASIVAERLILQAGLPRPRSWAGAQRSLEAVEVAEGGTPEMAATYLVGDSLAVGPADPQGYSIFYLADYETRRGYTPVYTEVRDYRRTGKAAPVFVDYLDWNEDGETELLIEVFGSDGSWYEAIGRRNGEWARLWEGARC